MPGFDGTGPEGKGPRTGRGLGYCNQSLEQRQGFGQDRGFRGHGFGRSMGQARLDRFANFQESIIMQDRLDNLKTKLQRLESEIDVLAQKLK